MTREVPDIHLWVDDTPTFPMFVYELNDTASEAPTLFTNTERSSSPHVRHNVTDHARDLYRSLDPSIAKDDIFFYVYGVLHSSNYRRVFAADLKKSLPRIPQVSTATDFWAFATAGRELATLHTDYETIEPWPALTRVHASGFRDDHPDACRVLKMKHPKVTDPATGQKVEDRSRIIYNDWITICDIPERAYDYELGSRSAIGWVMDAWRVRTDKASGIVNDPNDWAMEHDYPTYILDLVGRIVTVSMRTLEIVDSLPPLDL
jgi:predicted helicase